MDNYLIASHILQIWISRLFSFLVDSKNELSALPCRWMQGLGCRSASQRQTRLRSITLAEEDVSRQIGRRRHSIWASETCLASKQRWRSLEVAQQAQQTQQQARLSSRSRRPPSLHRVVQRALSRLPRPSQHHQCHRLLNLASFRLAQDMGHLHRVSSGGTASGGAAASRMHGTPGSHRQDGISDGDGCHAYEVRALSVIWQSLQPPSRIRQISSFATSTLVEAALSCPIDFCSGCFLCE